MSTVRNNKFDLGRVQESRAMNLYHVCYDNNLFIKATQDGNGVRKSNKYCNALINEALAVCGHPHYKLSDRKWSQEAIEFLQVFAPTGKD